jgi:uncharacterized LabA/DUF88 family protein
MAALHARPTRRMMVFVDGENLVFRYQDMLSNGSIPREDIFHEKDTAVWHPGFTHLALHHEILRVTYYTYVIGDDERITSVRESLRRLSFAKHSASLLPDSVTPCVFKKLAKSRIGKGVDIQLCVDVLSHVYRKNVDAVLIMSGDGDYAPLIEEALRNGVQVFISAFSSGFSPKLRDIADAVYELDGTTWK